VAETLCAEAAGRGLRWERYTPRPPGARPALTAVRRLGEVARFRAVAEPYDLLHVHYGLMSYYAMAAGKPFTLHLHGTDIRTAIDQNQLYRQLLLWGLRNAIRVYFSTPDLADATRKHRPDAQWLPAAVSAAAPVSGQPGPAAAQTDREARILFCSRWDDVKGSTELRSIAVRLRDLRPALRLIGLDWGQDAAQARTVGIETLPLMPHDKFRRLLQEVDLVIGQMRCGLPGVSELEALAAGTPVVMHLTPPDPYGCRPPVIDAGAESAPAAALALLDDVSQRARLRREGPEWVRRFHGADGIVSRLAEDYAQVG
jgi:glycosyltransferase involved in cell wall biosynthesis